MNADKLRDLARRHEQREEWRKAIETYEKLLELLESGAESQLDLPLYNKVGDLHARLGEHAAAVRYYERAVDLYAEQGFLNNAIALCRRIQRSEPNRHQVHLKLAELHTRKNFPNEARRHLVDYLDRMNADRRLDEAFAALRRFADQFAGDQVRLMLVELLQISSRESEAHEQLRRLVEELEARGDQVGAERARDRLADQVLPSNPGAPGPRGRDLVFLDVGTPSVEITPSAYQGSEVTGEIELSEVQLGGFETTRLAEAPGRAATPPELHGLEAFIIEHGSTAAGAAAAPAEPARPLEGLETTSEAPAPLPEEPLRIEHEVIETIEPVALADAPEPAAPITSEAPEAPAPPVPEPAPEPVAASAPDPVAAGLPEPAPAPVDPLELVPSPAMPEAPAPLEPPSVAPPVPEPAPVLTMRQRLEQELLARPHDPELRFRHAEVLLGAGETEEAVEALEDALFGFDAVGELASASLVIDRLVMLAPDAVRYHQKRVELAVRGGDRQYLVTAYLDLADALVRMGALDKAAAVYRRIADHEPENARALRALAALASDGEPVPATPAIVSAAPAPAAVVSPPAPAPPAPSPMVPVVPAAPAWTPAPAPAPEEPAYAPAAATATAETATAETAEAFVDLGGLVLEAEPLRNSRMKVSQQPATGDEQRDFQEVLEQFKKGLEAHVGLEDYEAHYDLGVAFKEMGLLDEAIAEFQKALRAPTGRLRTSEALGVSFFEKGEPAIAEAVLRRAVEGFEGGDDAKVGLIFWLGRAAEALGKPGEALGWYQRVLAVDIRFMDVHERIQRLTPGRRP